MTDTPKTIHVRVSAETDGYRKATRTSTLEVIAQKRDVVSQLSKRIARAHSLLRYAYPLLPIIPIIGMVLLFMSPIPTDSSFFLFAGMFCIFGVIATLVLAAVSTTWDHEKPAQMSAKARPKQSLSLVGKSHQDDAGNERPIARVRVESQTDDGEGDDCRAALLADYEDGSTSVLLNDLATDEVEELRACIVAHDIPVV